MAVVNHPDAPYRDADGNGVWPECQCDCNECFNRDDAVHPNCKYCCGHPDENTAQPDVIDVIGREVTQVSAYEVITKTLEPFIKDPKVLAKACNAVSTELDIGGWLTTDNDHLAMMRTSLKRLAERVAAEDCADRDLASLTNRLQQFSEKVTSMEEQQRQEGKIRRGSTNDRASEAKGKFGSKI